MIRLNKFLSIFKNRKELWQYAGDIIVKKQQHKILNKYGLNELNGVNVKNFFEKLQIDNEAVRITTDFSNGISPENDYYFICKIAKALKIKNYFEIGTWVGLSSKNISDNLPAINVYSLDIPPDHPEIRGFGIPFENFGYYAKNSPNVKFLKCDSMNFDVGPYKNKMDIVFVDGNHSQEYVENDTRIALNLIKNDSSVIIWHDYFLSGELNLNVLSGILNTIPQEGHKHLIYLEQSNIALYSKSFNFPKTNPVKWKIPETSFSATLQLNKL